MYNTFEYETEGFTSCWPYICVKGLGNFLQIYNVNVPDKIIRIEMPSHYISVPKTDITEDFDLFIIGETVDAYEMLKISLD